MDQFITLLAWLFWIGIGFVISAKGFTTILLPRKHRAKINHHRHNEEFFEEGLYLHPQDMCSSLMDNRAHYIIFLFVVWLSVFAISIFMSYGATEDADGTLIMTNKELNPSYTIGVITHLLSQISLFLFLIFYHDPDSLPNSVWNIGFAIFPAVFTFLFSAAAFVCLCLIISWHGIWHHILSQYYLWWLPILLYVPWGLYSIFVLVMSFRTCIQGNYHTK
jgi:hypothetical protein